MVVVVVGDQAESERVGPSEIIRHICKRGIVRFFFGAPRHIPVLPAYPSISLFRYPPISR